jgi:integrase
VGSGPRSRHARRGEALGLQWRDVDLDAATAFVHRNLTVANGRTMVNETKTAHGRRKIALDPATVTVLRRHRRHQLEEKLAADVAWEEHDLVFCGLDGRPIHPKQPTRWFREHIHAAGCQLSGSTTYDTPTRASRWRPVTPWSRHDAESRDRPLRARLRAVQVAGGQGIEPWIPTPKVGVLPVTPPPIGAVAPRGRVTQPPRWLGRRR